MNKVKILSGVSGVGKSTYAKMHFPDTAIVSADDFFRKDGVFKFDPTKIGEAHSDCFKHYITHITSTEDDIVVDNTNCEVWEIAPYILASNAFGYEHEIITLFIPRDRLEECASRNDGRATTTTISNQFDKLKYRVLPPFWNARQVTV